MVLFLNVWLKHTLKVSETTSPSSRLQNKSLKSLLSKEKNRIRPFLTLWSRKKKKSRKSAAKALWYLRSLWWVLTFRDAAAAPLWARTRLGVVFKYRLTHTHTHTHSAFWLPAWLTEFYTSGWTHGQKFLSEAQIASPGAEKTLDSYWLAGWWEALKIRYKFFLKFNLSSWFNSFLHRLWVKFMKQSKVNDSERFLLRDQPGEVRLLVLYHPMGLTSCLYNHRVSLSWQSGVHRKSPTLAYYLCRHPVGLVGRRCEHLSFKCNNPRRKSPRIFRLIP